MTEDSEGGRAGAPAVLTRTDFHGAIRRNRRNTVWLCLVMILIGAAFGYVIGWAAEFYYVSEFDSQFEPETLQWTEDILTAVLTISVWGQIGAAAMFAGGTIWVMVALSSGDRILLAMTGAQEVSLEIEPVLHNVVEEMTLAAGLPKPRVLVMESPALNAFATGLKPERSAIAVTRGLLDRLERPELQGVVAHEMGHIANNDILYATAIGVVVGLITLVSDAVLRGALHSGQDGSRRSRKKSPGAMLVFAVVLLFAILAPIAAWLVQMAISREREYLADATAVKLTRNPLGLIGALQKIDTTGERFKSANRAIQHLFIANPFRKFGPRSAALFSTHPPMPDRIERLRNLG